MPFSITTTLSPRRIAASAALSPERPPQLYARARVMGSYPEIVAKPNICVTENQRRRCASAIRARPAFVLGPVDSPPWNRQRRFPGTTLMMHGAPALVLAQHLGRNLRFKGSPLCDR